MKPTIDEDVTHKFIFSPILKLAIEEAKLSTYQHKIGAVIFKGKRIVSSAHNSIRSNNVPSRFKAWTESLHAESHAIIKARKNLKDYSILVVRYSSKTKLSLAKPCDFCMDFIKYVGITKIFYSDSNGRILAENKFV